MKYAINYYNATKIYDNLSNGTISFADFSYSKISTQMQNDNALFYQIREELKDEIDPNDVTCLKSKIIFLDFSNKNFDDINILDALEEESAESIENDDNFNIELFTPEEENNLCKDEKIIYSLFGNGFIVKGFETQTHYVPFEKSASQAKGKICSFIDQKLFLALKKRLDLDIFFGDYELKDKSDYISVKVPKLPNLFAYRGLYLTDGERVTSTSLTSSDAKYISLLNEKSFIVIEDFIDQKENIDFNFSKFSASKINTEKNSNKIKLQKEIKSSCDFNDQDKKISKVYDGEGLISPLGAAFINFSLFGKTNRFKEIFGAFNLNLKDGQIEFLHSIYELYTLNTPISEICESIKDKYYIQNDNLKDLVENLINESSFSFQIRFPFVKGMVHTCNFQNFFEEKGLLTKTSDTNISDVFNIKRNLNEVHVIIPSTIFKLHKLNYDNSVIYKLPPEFNGDPMKYYFSKIKKYHHGFYISATDRPIKDKTRADITYQQISTFNLSERELNTLIDRHIEYADIYKLDNLFENPDLAGEKEDWTDIIKVDRRFLNDDFIKHDITLKRKSLLKNIYFGKLSVPGNMRFLSRDIVAYLYDIAKQLTVGISDEKKKELKLQKNKEKIFAGKVCCPQFECQDDMLCALLRSPHLSESENVSVAFFGGSDEFKKYCNHLSGVTMIAANAYANTALGGADFDGDEVIFTTDDIISNACLHRGFNEYADVYLELSPNRKVLERNRNPILVDIPSFGGDNFSTEKANTYKYVNPTVIKNTFDSQIGSISNKALKISAVKFYDAEKYNKLGDDKKIDPEMFCILTGVEIDSTKNGNKPDLAAVDSTMKELKESFAFKQAESYLKNKEIFKKTQYFTKESIEKKLVGCFKKIKGNEIMEKQTCFSVLLERFQTASFNDKLSQKVDISEIFDVGEITEQENNFVKNATSLLKCYFDWEKVRTDYNSQIRRVILYKSYFYSVLREQFPISWKEKRHELDQAMESIKLNDADIEELLKTYFNDNFFDTSIKLSNLSKLWPLFKSENRQSELNIIFGDKTINVFNNFSSQGYLLLMYFLMAARHCVLAKKYLDIDCTGKSDDFVEIINIFVASVRDKKSPSECKKEIFVFLENRLDSIANENNITKSRQIQLLYGIQKQYSQILWNVYGKEAILEAVKGGSV